MSILSVIEKFKSNIFFENKTYHDLAHDSLKLSFFLDYNPKTKIGFQVTCPYLLLISMLACHQRSLVAILLPASMKDEQLKLFTHAVKPLKTFKDQDIRDFLFNPAQPIHPSFSDDQFNQNTNAPFIVVFTSGTTSGPKGVALSLNNILFSSLGFVEFFNQSQNETTLINLPLHHVSGFMPLWRSFFSGGKITINQGDEIQFISLVPTQLQHKIRDHQELIRLKKIRCILVGGGMFSEDLKNKAKSLRLNCFETYGMTETTSLMTIDGFVLPYRNISLDSDGYFEVDGQTLALGYFENDIFLPLQKPFKTKDIGTITSDGSFRFLCRGDLIFKSGGENINPSLVENVIRELDAINDCLLIPINDKKWGQMGILLYESKSSMDVTYQNLKNHCLLKLPAYMIPKHIFNTSLNTDFSSKPKRNDFKKKAHQLYLTSIFNFQFIDNQGPSTLVFFHGFLGDLNDLFFYSQHIPKKYNLLFIDLPGHGKSLIKNFFDLEDTLVKMRDFLSFFGDSFIYYGYSMGGRLAIELSLNYLSPQKLILESSSFGLKNLDQKEERMKKDLKLFENYQQVGISSFLEHWYKQEMFFDYNKSQNYEDDLKYKSQHSIKEWQQAALLFSPAHLPLREDNLRGLESLNCPIHYIYGSNDESYKAQKAPQFHYHEIANAGHNPHKTQRNQMVSLLSKLLQDS